jgi:hypothetical protein
LLRKTRISSWNAPFLQTSLMKGSGADSLPLFLKFRCVFKPSLPEKDIIPAEKPDLGAE